MIDKKKVAKMLGVSERTIDRYRAKGMPCYTLPGGTLRFKTEEVMEWLKNITG